MFIHLVAFYKNNKTYIFNFNIVNSCFKCQIKDGSCVFYRLIRTTEVYCVIQGMTPEELLVLRGIAPLRIQFIGNCFEVLDSLVKFTYPYLCSCSNGMQRTVLLIGELLQKLNAYNINKDFIHN